MPTPNTVISVVGAALAAVSLCGCDADSGIYRTPGGPEAAFTVLVRDALSHEPIAGATVLAETPSRDHPFSAATILGQTQPVSARATTNDRGEATLTCLRGRPVRIGILAAGVQPSFILFDPNPADATDVADWLPITPEAGLADRPCEIRVVATPEK